MQLTPAGGEPLTNIWRKTNKLQAVKNADEDRFLAGRKAVICVGSCDNVLRTS